MLLAPVVKERKGEHVKLLQELQAQGFVRARIDGEVVELDSPPPLDLRRKHTIEVVVDRFKVRDDLGLRLAESFETALKLANGIARIAFLDEPGRDELLFSAGFSCPVCGYSLSELEPRLFSFNNPVGACGECDGLGVKQYFDAERVVAHPHLSLARGAVRGWDRENFYYFQLIKALARHFHFEVDTPFQELPERIRTLILHGSGHEALDFDYHNSKRRDHPSSPSVRGHDSQHAAPLSGNRIESGAR
jgi:excinuclease ABC subunit A